MDVLRIEYPSAGGWVKPLMTRINSSSSSALRDRMTHNWDPPGAENSLGDLALAVSSKIAMLPSALRRVETRLRELDQHLKDEPRMVDSLRNGAVYKVRDDKVLWELLLDIDCYLFEMYSTFDILDAFVKKFCRLILKRKAAPVETERLLAERNAAGAWLDDLRNSRNTFSHAGAPWIALEVTAKSPFRFELLILKRNVEDLTDPSTYLHINQCLAIWSGLSLAFDHVREWLNEQIDDCERTAQ